MQNLVSDYKNFICRFSIIKKKNGGKRGFSFMKKMMKHTLLVAVLVICFFAVSMVAVAAEDFNGATESTTDSVASITSEGTTYYYDSFSAALADARANSPAEIVVLKDTSGTSDDGVYSAYDITVKGANANVALTMPRKTFASGSGSLKFEDIVLKMTEDAIYYPDPCEASVSFKNVKMELNGNYNMEIGSKGATLSVTMIDCEIAHASPSNTAYFLYAPKSTLTYNISGLKTNAAIFYSDVPVSVNLTLAGINNTTTNPLIRGTSYTIEGFGDDATAKQYNYTHRVGDTAGGKIGVVYFKSQAEAFSQAPFDKKVYNISGTTPVEIPDPCDHEAVHTVVNATCATDGYTEHKCNKCNRSYKDNFVEASGHQYSEATCTKKAKCSVCNEETGELAPHTKGSEATCIKKAVCSVCNSEMGELIRHKYSLATCTKKAACSVCGLERGELAKHIDLDKNDKCDKCDAKMAVEEVTTTEAPATEEKKGCGGTVGVAGLALVAALGSCALFVEKKRK